MNKDMKFFSKLQSSKGFTLVELLVVIAIIGILAAGVLVAINPLEQIRRTQDQSLITTSQQYLGALNAYAAAKGSMPWGSVTGCTTPASTLVSNLGSCTTALISSGDLKQGSGDQTTVLSKLYLTETAGTGGVTSNVMCFRPTSSQVVTSTEKNRYTINGGTCATPGTTACYVCVF